MFGRPLRGTGGLYGPGYGPGGGLYGGGYGGGGLYGGGYGPGVPPASPYLSPFYSGLRGFGSVTDGFVRVAHLLDGQWAAMHSSFLSLLRLFDSVQNFKSELYLFVQMIAGAKFLYSLFEWRLDTARLQRRSELLRQYVLVANPHSTPSSTWPPALRSKLDALEFTHRERKRRVVPVIGVLAVVMVLFGPRFAKFMWKWVKRKLTRSWLLAAETPPRVHPTDRLSPRTTTSEEGNKEKTSLVSMLEDADAEDASDDDELSEESRVARRRQRRVERLDLDGIAEHQISEARARKLVGSIAVAKHPFQPQRADEMSLQRGDLVKITSVVSGTNGGWVNATRADNVEGLIPTTFVKRPVPPEPSTATTTSSVAAAAAPPAMPPTNNDPQQQGRQPSRFGIV